MQNLTARYNYIYNANLILKDHQAELISLYPENYDQVLNIYPGPKYLPGQDQPAGLSDQRLDEIIQKSQAIISEKSFSNYLDEAYLLIGKASFYKNNYYNSTEYFDYTAKAYKSNLPVFIQALTWKAMSLMQLGHLMQATEVTDTLKKYVAIQKKKTAEPYAIQAQLFIHKGKYAQAIPVLDSAIRFSKDKHDRIRWTYLLAQLYEKEKQYEESLSKYKKVQKSNTGFEMYFNANLNIIRINNHILGASFNKEGQLLSLLKDDKSLEYNDQVYFQIASIYQEQEKYKEAEQYYILSANASTENQYQKALSYLHIADLNFKHFRNYIQAKQYYDSAVISLPKSFKDYALVLKKAQNLEYLTSRFQNIARQDTLQSIALLPEEQRRARIEAIISGPERESTQALRELTLNTSVGNSSSGTNRRTTNTPASGSVFYFSNSAAVGKGFSDFKRQWGNRNLEENWRQSIKSSYQSTLQGDPDKPGNATIRDSLNLISRDKSILIKEFIDSLPLTPDMLAYSNQKIIDSYFEIASYYQQELQDREEAIRINQILLKRFPDNTHEPAIYYSLYLSYIGIDDAESERYKELILSKYPISIYAKAILDPSFSIKQNELEAAAIKRYNEIFGHYQRKEFKDVINKVDTVLASSDIDYLSPQLAYLKAIAIGRNKPVDPLLQAFRDILTTYSNDKLIVPLVQGHIEYITENLSTFRTRDTALVDFDPNEPVFIRPAAPSVAQKPIQPVASVATPPITPVKTDATKTLPPSKETSQKPAAAAPDVRTDGLFSSAASQQYYFVVNVSDASLTLSSSRFGIGQFNRGTYAGSNLKHQLFEFDNEQLIYVGNFSTLEAAKQYAAAISPQLPKIMKVPANIYITFVVSKENLDKITSKNLINRYIEFYKKNLQ